MKKKCLNGNGCLSHFKKFLLIMKLAIFLIFSGLISVSASVYSQATRLSMDMKGVSVLDVFKQIESQSEFVFIYKNEVIDLNKKVDVKVEGSTVDEILDQVFKDLGLKYEIIKKQIIVTPDRSIPSTKPDKVILEEQQQPQKKELKGRITESSGAPIPGVSVSVKGTTQGTITDVNGNYSLLNLPANATIQFSFLGMKTQQVKVESQTNINIVLEQETVGLEEVVAVGYGTQKKVNLTGAISSVSASVLKDRPLTSLGQGLEGTIANLNVNIVDGQPGRAATFNIRGYTGLGVSESPLILVDGVIMDPNLINPSDVASVTVLKDAASAAIYGARAAYGVILITTKNGKKNQAAKVNYSGNISYNSPTRYPKIANSWDTFLYTHSAFGVPAAPQDYQDKIYAHYKDPTQPYAELQGNVWQYYANTDWYHEAMLSQATTDKQDVNISGGGDKVTYYFSGGLQDQGGLYRYGNDDYKRYNFRSDVNVDLKSWISVNFKGIFTKTAYNSPTTSYGLGPWWHSIVKMPNSYPVKNPDGQWDTALSNPIQFLSDGGRDITQGIDSWVVFGTEIRPFDGFKIKSDFSQNSSATNERDYKKELFTTLPNGIITPTTYTTSPYAWQQNTTLNYYAFNVWGEYEKTFNKIHYFKALLGYNQEQNNSRFFNAKRYDPINSDIGEISLATGAMEAGSGAGSWAVRGAFFRLNYIFDEKYLIEVNGRYDGTSKFPKNDRFGFFPSISGGWRISNESFMKWMKPAVNELKLRASYGTLGNQNVSGNYPYISSMNYYQNNDGDGRLASFQDGQKVMVVDPSGLVSPTLTWVKLKTLDFGFDFSMAKNRLNFSGDWYNRETDGILGTQAAPAILGTNPPLQNLYSMGTKGWELTFSWKDRINENLSYNVGFNLSDYTGTVIKYDANPTHYIFDYYNGQTLGDIWGWTVNKLFQTNDEATAYENQYKQSLVFGTPPGGYMAGDIKVEDINKNGAIDKGTETADNPGDRSVIGNNTPRYSFGITGGVQWKGFDFNIFFQGVGKRDWQMGQGNNSALLWGSQGLPWNYNLDYWSPTNTGAYFPRVGGIEVSETTRYLQNAAYIRLKSLVVGYTIPKPIVQRFGIDIFRVYVSGQNLWTYTKLIDGVDPEGIQDPNGYGDGEVYPIQKSLSVGLNVTF